LRKFGIVGPTKNSGVSKGWTAKAAKNVVLDRERRQRKGRGGRYGALDMFKKQCLVSIIEGFELG
jgi:hypothetical protein